MPDPRVKFVPTSWANDDELRAHWARDIIARSEATKGRDFIPLDLSILDGWALLSTITAGVRALGIEGHTIGVSVAFAKRLVAVLALTEAEKEVARRISLGAFTIELPRGDSSALAASDEGSTALSDAARVTVESYLREIHADSDCPQHSYLALKALDALKGVQ